MRHAVRHLFSVLLERRAKRRDSTLGAVRFCSRVQNGAGWVSEDRGQTALDSWPDLAATRSPTLRRAVPWALRSFTAGFGMEPGGASAL
jgi:hypothetical protein